MRLKGSILLDTEGNPILNENGACEVFLNNQKDCIIKQQNCKLIPCEIYVSRLHLELNK